MIAPAVDTSVGDGGRSRNGVLAPAPNARRLAVSGATYQADRLASVFVGHNQSVTTDERDVCRPVSDESGCGKTNANLYTPFPF